MATVAEATQDTVKPQFSTVESDSKEKKSKLPKPAAYTLTAEDCYSYLKSLSEQDWAHTAVYIYRHYPVIVRDPSNIDQPTVAIDEAYMMENHGSGRYEIKVNDADTGKTVCHSFPDYNNPAFPPKFDIRELDPFHKKNRLIVEKLKREGKMTQDGDVVTPGKSDNGDATMAGALKEIAIEAMRGRQEKPGLENQAFGKMMEMMASASKQSIEIALNQVKKEDPASFIALLTTAKELFAPATPKPETESPMYAALMRMLDAAEKRAEQAAKDAKEERERADKDRVRAHELELQQRKQAHELELERLKQKAEQASPIAMVKEVLTLQKELGQLGVEDNRKWPEKLVDEGMAHVPELLNLAGKAIDRLGYQRTQAQQPAQQQPQRPAQPQPAQSPTQTQTTPPQPQTQPQAEQPPMPEQPSDPDIAFLLPIFEQQGARFVQAFQQDPNGGGHHIAKDVLFYAGAAVYERIARMGREKILATIHLIDAMEKDLMKVGTKEMLNDFIDDFIAGPDEEEDDDDDQFPDDPDGEGDEPSRPADAVAKKKVPA